MPPLHKPDLQKIYETFGKQKGLEVLLQEYHDASNTELEITKLRWTVYTAFLAVSLTLSGYLWANPSLDLALKKIGLVGGALVHLIAYYLNFARKIQNFPIYTNELGVPLPPRLF